MQNDDLFSEFEAVSTKQWKQKIQFDLKGADYNERLVWESLEGIKVKPFYDTGDLDGKSNFSLPKNHSWKIGQVIYTGNPKLANKKALDALSRGAQSLIFEIPDHSVAVEELLAGIDLKTTPIHLAVGFLEPKYLKKFAEIVEKEAKIYLNIDLLGNLAGTGNWFFNLKNDYNLLEEIVGFSNENPSINIISVDASLYQNSGANIVQQLAYALSHANEYLNHFDNILLHAKEKPVVFKVAIGQNYFFEIAKLRALRWLWQILSSEYGLKHDCHILAIPSRRNKTLYDYNVNMLRTTSECMAAILGGANTVYNLTYDAIYHKDNEFGERIARNQLLLLKEESYFEEAVLAAEGNYYLNSLTEQLAQKALGLFKQLEANGGFLKHLLEGTIQRKIKESAEKEQALFDSAKTVLTGTNKYENPDDRMKGNLELYPFLKTDKRKTVLEPILKQRLSEELEQKRIKQED